jgi:hypothetical protein
MLGIAAQVHLPHIPVA